MILPSISIFNSLTLPQMQNIARILAQELGSRDVLTLSGEIGAGKTTFARVVIETLSVKKVEVTSPTFNIMQSYDIKRADGVVDTLWHLDLYRIERQKDADNLGLDELWPHVSIVEWPDLIQQRLPQHHLDILFDFGETGDTRKLVFSGDIKWQERLKDKQWGVQK